MPRKPHSTSARRRAHSRIDTQLKLLRLDVERLGELVAMLQAQSDTNLRRIGELHHELDVLRKIVTPPSHENVSSRPDGPARA